MDLYLRINRLGREGDYLPTFSADIKKDSSYTSPAPPCLKDVYFTTQFTFLFMCLWLFSLGFLDAFPKFRKATFSFVASAYLSFIPRGSNGLLVGEFSRNLVFEYFWKICREKSSLFNIWKELHVLYTKTCLYLWRYPAELFWEWELLQKKL